MSFTEKFSAMMREKENEIVRWILKDCDLNSTVITQHATLLHRAAEHGNIDMVKYLLEKGFGVNAQDLDGNTPLMKAVEKSGGKILKILLAAGANIDIKNNLDQDVLRLALNRNTTISVHVPVFQALRRRYSRQEIIDKLMDYKCGLDQAVCSKDVMIVEYMLKHGHPINLPNKFPLHVAVILGHVQMVKILLEYGAEVEKVSESGATPLHFLYSGFPGNVKNKLQILKYLLWTGASVTSLDSRGYYQSGNVLTLGTSDMIREILRSKPDTSAREVVSGGTLLHVLTLNKNPGVVDVLKPYIGMFDINAEDNSGHGPLSWAISEGNTIMVKFLLDEGAIITEGVLLCPYLAKIDSQLEFARDQCLEMILERCADPQAIFTATSSKTTNLIVDDIVENKRFDRLNLALARLAICEKQGVTVNEHACSKINSHKSLKRYFEKCRRLLRKNVYGTLSLFQLLDADDKKMARYLKNRKLISKLMRLNHNSKLKCDYWFYYSILKKRVSKGFVTKALRDKAAEFICEISGDRLDPQNLAMEMVLDCLNDQDLRNVYAL